MEFNNKSMGLTETTFPVSDRIDFWEDFSKKSQQDNMKEDSTQSKVEKVQALSGSLTPLPSLLTTDSTLPPWLRKLRSSKSFSSLYTNTSTSTSKPKIRAYTMGTLEECSFGKQRELADTLTKLECSFFEAVEELDTKRCRVSNKPENWQFNRMGQTHLQRHTNILYGLRNPFSNPEIDTSEGILSKKGTHLSSDQHFSKLSKLFSILNTLILNIKNMRSKDAQMQLVEKTLSELVLTAQKVAPLDPKRALMAIEFFINAIKKVDSTYEVFTFLIGGSDNIKFMESCIANNRNKIKIWCDIERACKMAWVLSSSNIKLWNFTENDERRIRYLLSDPQKSGNTFFKILALCSDFKNITFNKGNVVRIDEQEDCLLQRLVCWLNAVYSKIAPKIDHKFVDNQARIIFRYYNELKKEPHLEKNSVIEAHNQLLHKVNALPLMLPVSYEMAQLLLSKLYPALWRSSGLVVSYLEKKNMQIQYTIKAKVIVCSTTFVWTVQDPIYKDAVTAIPVTIACEIDKEKFKIWKKNFNDGTKTVLDYKIILKLGELAPTLSNKIFLVARELTKRSNLCERLVTRGSDGKVLYVPDDSSRKKRR